MELANGNLLTEIAVPTSDQLISLWRLFGDNSAPDFGFNFSASPSEL